MKLILSLLKGSQRQFLFAILLSGLSAVAGVSVIAFINEAISQLSRGGEFPVSIFSS